jgi:hypothetical protein
MENFAGMTEKPTFGLFTSSSRLRPNFFALIAGRPCHWQGPWDRLILK